MTFYATASSYNQKQTIPNFYETYLYHYHLIAYGLAFG